MAWDTSLSRKEREGITGRLKEWLRAKGWTPAELARRMGITDVHRASKTYRWLKPPGEKGSTLPESPALHSLSARAGLSIDWLFGHDVPMEVDARTPAGNLARDLTRHLVEYSLSRADHEHGPVRRSVLYQRLGLEPESPPDAGRRKARSTLPELARLSDAQLDAVGPHILAEVCTWFENEVARRERLLARRETEWLEERLVMRGIELDKDYEKMSKQERALFFQRLRETGQMLARRTATEKIADGEPFPDLKTEVALSLNYRKRGFYADLPRFGERDALPKKPDGKKSART
jgi:hypothetical protein